MTRAKEEQEGGQKLLLVVADLLEGQRHSRRSIAKRAGRSLATADRWIEQIVAAFPKIRRVREGKTTWLYYDERPVRPSKAAAVGVSVAASLASLFEGSQHERNLKDARDHLLQLRGISYGDLDRKFFFVPKGGEIALPDAQGELDEIIDALLESSVLRFAYRHNDGREEDVSLQPLTLVIFNQQFYLLAFREDGSPYCYRFSRMSKVERMDETFTYPTRNEFDPRVVFAPTFGIFVSLKDPIEEVEVIISGPWANFAKTHRWHPSQQVVTRGDGTVAITLRVRHCPEVETWVLGFGEYAEVSKPKHLAEAVCERLRRASARYEVSRPRLAKAGAKRTKSANRRNRASTK